MADRPIIFSAPMVRALLEGRKTQTRRLLGYEPAQAQTIPDNATWAPDHGFKPDRGAGQMWSLHSPYLNGSRLWHGGTKVRYAKGDRLYVRENWRVSPEACEGWHPEDMRGWIDYQAGGSLEVVAPSFDAVEKAAFLKGEDRDWDFLPSRYRPCIHMPRWASRLTLTVEDVRVERLQEISDADAIAEGLTYDDAVECRDGVSRPMWFGTPQCGYEATPGAPRRAYLDLWDSLHNPRGLCADDEPASAEANPFVVAVTFRVERGNIDTPTPDRGFAGEVGR